MNPKTKISMTQNKNKNYKKLLLKQSQLTSKICNNIINNKDTLPTLEKNYWLENFRIFLNYFNNFAINKIYLT